MAQMNPPQCYGVQWARVRGAYVTRRERRCGRAHGEPLAKTNGGSPLSVIGRSARHSRRGSPGAVWSFALPQHALEAPFCSPGAPKLAKDEEASAGAMWQPRAAHRTEEINRGMLPSPAKQAVYFGFSRAEQRHEGLTARPRAARRVCSYGEMNGKDAESPLTDSD